MANSDASPSLQAISNIPEPIARIGALAKWITVRMDDLKNFETRLETRIEHLNKTEDNLKKLFDSLRAEVSAAHPLLSQLGAMRQQLSEKGVSVDQTKPTPAMPKAQEIEQRLNELVKSADETILKRINSFDEDLNATVETAKLYLHSAAESTKADAGAITEALAHKIELAEKVIHDLTQRLDAKLQEGVDKAYDAIDLLAEPIKRKITDQFSEFEQRIQTAIKDVEAEMENRAASLNKRIDSVSVSMEQQMSLVSDDFAKHSEMTVIAARHQMRQQLDAMEAEIRLASQPIMQAIDQQRTMIDAIAGATVQTIEESLKGRIDEFRKHGETMVEIIEAQLMEKIKAIRPQAQSSISLIEKQFAQRLDLAVDTARQAIELSEQQLMDRIAELRPRATAAAMAAQKELTEQLTVLETEASAATNGISQRLSQRIDELTYHARRSIAEEIKALDDAAEKLRRNEKVMQKAQGEGSVQVEIHVEQPGKTNVA
jgi:hypothetical protein